MAEKYQLEYYHNNENMKSSLFFINNKQYFNHFVENELKEILNRYDLSNLYLMKKIDINMIDSMFHAHISSRFGNKSIPPNLVDNEDLFDITTIRIEFNNYWDGDNDSYTIDYTTKVLY